MTALIIWTQKPAVRSVKQMISLNLQRTLTNNPEKLSDANDYANQLFQKSRELSRSCQFSSVINAAIM